MKFKEHEVEVALGYLFNRECQKKEVLEHKSLDAGSIIRLKTRQIREFIETEQNNIRWEKECRLIFLDDPDFWEKAIEKETIDFVDLSWFSQMKEQFEIMLKRKEIPENVKKEIIQPKLDMINRILLRGK